MESTSDHFPAGLRVLVVDDDPICLLIVERLLRSCLYQVTTCKEAVIALSMLRENRSRFDVVLSDVHMPDMDGFKLLELVRLEMDVPVIMMSANGETSNVMKGISQGACDYLLKPVRLEELQNIWQHVVRKEHKTLKESEHAPNPKDYQRPRQMQTDGNMAVLPADEENGFCSSQRKRKGPLDEDSANEEDDNLAAVKRQRVVWSVDLHQKFISAINHLGLEQAVPKRILDLMNVPGLTRENVASHLQKYRIYLKRMSGGSVNQQLGMARCIGPTGSFMNSLAFMNGFSNSQAVGQFSRQAMLTPQLGISGGGHGLESMDGDFIGVMKAGTDPCIDYKEYVMAQYLDPTLQGHFGLASSAKDSKLSTVPQNTLGFSLLQQGLGVPKSSSFLFSGGPSCNELSASGTDQLFMHQLQTAAELHSLGYNDSLSGSELVER